MQKPRRSVLYVPASNGKALAKAASLACDALIFDLEDAVAPDAKAQARETLRAFFRESRPVGPELVVRVNGLDTEWGSEDLLAARACVPDAILVPKVDGPRGLQEIDDALDEMDADPALKLWIMIETPRALLNLREIVELGRNPGARLQCLVAGTNDLAKETGVAVTPDRRYLLPSLMQIVVAARASGLDALDGVSNDFTDLEAFARECAEGRGMGFSGKTLIHPAQIAPANAAFSPSEAELAEARAIVAAFALPENEGKGAISIAGRMVERLHLAQAERVLVQAERTVG